MDTWILPKLPFALPTHPVPPSTNLTALAQKILLALPTLQPTDLLPLATWRDVFALTGLPRTFYTRASVAAAWKATTAAHRPSDFALDGAPRVVRTPAAEWVEIRFTFATRGVPPAAEAYGTVSVALDEDGEWRVWILRTILEGLSGLGDVDVLAPARGVPAADGQAANGRTDGSGTNGVINIRNGTHGVNNAHVPSPSLKKSLSGVEEHMHVAIIGGGQAGLAVGGRLKALGVEYVILEKHAQVGDNWATRYDSAKLHTIREFAHLPFEKTFGPEYPEFLTKDDLAKGYREWADKYDINIRLSTTLLNGSWDKTTSTWTLNIESKGGKKSTMRANHVVFCVGANSQIPLAPTYENRDAFKGIILHSKEYSNAKAWKGKHGIVVGTANTAHDVADDMVAAGLASVTMVQRSPTYVVPIEHYRDAHDGLYNAHTPTVVADRLFFTGPIALGRITGSASLHAKARAEPARFDALAKSGFRLDRTGDMTYYLLEKIGGHYMDVGTSAKIADGRIKMKSDALPVRYTASGLECTDGTHLRADVVVFATGFVGNVRVVVGELLGKEVSDQIEDYWGLDEEGELRGAYKPCGHPGFWYCGGAVGQARYMSRFIALQIKAMAVGTPLRVYRETPPRLLGEAKM